MMFKVGDVVTEPSKSPVRTVTRREIVPGVYGTVRVGFRGEEYVNIRMERDYHTAAELREAAHLFSQLAEVLEDG